MKHLFLFTVTPVQSFIAEARKVQDLAAGSQMLSDFIDQAIKYLLDRNFLMEEDVIFPSTELESKPNRFLAFIDTNEPEKVGKDLEKHIREEVFLDNAQEKLKEFYPNHLNNALNQLKDFLKIYWIAIPYSGDYVKDNQKIERLLGGIKNLRAFEQFQETGRKCSINGEYNVTIFKKNEKGNEPSWLNYTTHVQTYEYSDDRKIGKKQLAPGEGLCTLNFYKRVYLPKNDSGFDATCQVAYLDAVQIIKQNKEAFEKLEKLQDYDEQYVYDDAIIKHLGEDRKSIKRLQRELKVFCKERSLKIGKYYAVLVFDADKMGDWLAGKKLANPHQDQLKFQRKLSKLFGKFAAFARDFVDGNNGHSKKGQTIYAGGDDYLGLINLSYLFEVLGELNREFERIVWTEGLKSSFEFKEETPMSFSAGVAVTHYKTPLSFVLNEARKAEKRAKSKDAGGRNAIAVTVLKRSGEVHQSHLKWYDVENNYLLDDFEVIVEALNTKTSSNKFITAFSEEFSPIVTEKSFGRDNKELIKIELSRLLKDNNLSKDKEQNSVLRLMDYFISDRGRLQDFIYLLNIADFISREIGELQKPAELCQ